MQSPGSIERVAVVGGDSPGVAVASSRSHTSPARAGFLIGIVTGAVFFVVGFTGGYGPRVSRLTGNPGWVTLLELVAAVAMVVGAVRVARRLGGTGVGAASVFSYLGGWCGAIALTIAIAIFFDARSRLTTYGLVDGAPDPLAGTLAAQTRKAHNTLAVVDAFLGFVGTFAVSYVVLAVLTVIVRSFITLGTKILRLVGLLPPETIADF